MAQTPTKTTFGLLRKSLDLTVDEMAYELGLKQTTVRNFGSRHLDDFGHAERISQCYKVSRDWLMNGDPSTGIVIDIYDREHRGFSREIVTSLRDRHSPHSYRDENVDLSSPYAIFLAWVTAAHRLAHLVETPEDLKEVTINIPRRRSSGVTQKCVHLIDLLTTESMWEKDPLMAIDCLLHGSELMHSLPIADQVSILRKTLVVDTKRTELIAHNELAKEDSDLEVLKDCLEDRHDRI